MASKKSERSYGLSAQEVKQLAEEYKATKKFPNPHRTGAYKFTINALVTLGANKPHPIAKVHQAFRKAAGDDWYQLWASKEPRNSVTAKDADGRFRQNLQVLQRHSQFGRRLFEAGKKVLRTKGAVIDLTRDSKGGLLVTLNTNSATPLKALRAAPQRRKETISRKPATASKRRRLPERLAEAGQTPGIFDNFQRGVRAIARS